MYQAKFQLPHRPEQSPEERERELHFALLREFKAIEAAVGQGGKATVVTIGGGGGGGGGSSSLITRSVDLTTIINPTTEIRFDTDDGYVLSNAGAGIARLDFNQTANSYYRCGSNAVLSTGTAITFSKILSDAVILPLSCVNANGDQIGVDISNITTTGFLATPIEDATLVWLALPDWVPRSGVAVIQPGGTTVVLQSPYADTSYGILVKQCFNSNGDAIGVTLSAKTATDFVADPIETATLYYSTVKFQ